LPGKQAVTTSSLLQPGHPLVTLMRRVEGLLGLIAALTLLGLMLLTCIDVAGRYLFDRPLPGGFELTELGMGALIFTSLPLVTLRRQHVRVDLFENLISARWQALQQAFLDLLSGACMAVIAWRLWVKAADMASAGETTATLQIPVYPLVYGMAVLAFVTTALIVLFACLDALGARNAQVTVTS
jgi:TRAP-type C4-dicarboxylate transport system permease small subunit